MMILFILFVLLTMWFPLMVGYRMFQGLNEGVVRTRPRPQDPDDTYGAYSRTKDPFQFWTLIATYGAFIAVFGYYYVKIYKVMLYGE